MITIDSTVFSVVCAAIAAVFAGMTGVISVLWAKVNALESRLSELLPGQVQGLAAVDKLDSCTNPKCPYRL